MKAKTEAKSKTEAEAKAKSKEPAGLILGLRWSPSDFRNRRCRWYERRKRRRGKPRRRESAASRRTPNMGFAAIYVADFMVQAVVRAEPGLRNCAIALLEGTPPLRKVVAANEAALRAGIELGMTESQAEDFCVVQVHPRSPAQEKTAHAALMDLGWSVSPRV